MGRKNDPHFLILHGFFCREGKKVDFLTYVDSRLQNQGNKKIEGRMTPFSYFHMKIRKWGPFDP